MDPPTSSLPSFLSCFLLGQGFKQTCQTVHHTEAARLSSNYISFPGSNATFNYRTLSSLIKMVLGLSMSLVKDKAQANETSFVSTKAEFSGVS